MASTTASAANAGVAQHKTASQLVFNFNLLAYDPQITDRAQHQIIRVKSLTKPKDTNTLLRGDDPELPSLGPAPEEIVLAKELANVSEDTAVFVGLRLPRLSEEDSGIAHRKRKSINTLASLDIVSPDPKAMRVVCPRFKDTATFYALYHQDPDTKLCKGALIGGEDVFFFPEYRTSEDTSASKRKSTWLKIVRDSMGTTEVKERKKRAFQDSSRLIVPIARRIPNEIASFDAQYGISGSISFVKLMQDMFDKLDAPAKNGFLLRNINLCNLINGKDDCNLENCSKAFEEIKVMWPKVANLIGDATILCTVFKCVRAAGIVLPYDQVRMFLVTCGKAVQATDTSALSKEACATIASDSMEHIALLLGDSPATAPLEEEVTYQTPALCFKFAEFLRELSTLMDSRLTDLSDTQSGGTATACSLPELWNRYAQAVDTDSAKLYATEIHRFVVHEIGHVFSEIQALVKEEASTFHELAEETVKVLKAAAALVEEEED